MAEALATLAEVQAGLEWTLTDQEEDLATGALESLSDDARFYGTDRWIDDSAAPRQVLNIVIRACRRYLRNPDGFTTSRAGDETVTWTDRRQESGDAHFTDREIKMLGELGGGRSDLVSVELTTGPRKPALEGYVPVIAPDREKPFPFFGSDTEPW